MRAEVSVVVDRPIDEVWAFLADFFNVPRWGKAQLGFRQTSPGPMGVGTTFEGRVVLFGLERRGSGVVTEWDPPHTMVISARGMGGSLRVRIEVNLSRLDRHASDGTKVVRVVEAELRGIWRLLSPIFRLFLRRWTHAESQNLKRLLEADRG